MSNPAVQNLIRLTNFFVTQLEFKMDSREYSKDVEGEPLKIELQQNIGLPQTPLNSFIVIFELKISDEANQSVSLSLRAVAEFKTSSPVDAEFGASPFVQINAPAIAFPFLRSYVHTVTMHSGAPGIILPAINFMAGKGQQPTTKASPSPNDEGDKPSN